MKRTRLISMLLFVSLLIGLFPVEALAAKGEYDMPYYITVDQTNQITTVYRTSDDVIVRQMLCSCGKNGATVTGTYYMPKGENKMDRTDWYLFTGFRCYAKFPTRIFKGILFHSITYNRQSESAMSKSAIEAFGKADSHGCIRLLVPDAEWIQKNCDIGTKVVSYYSKAPDEELRTLLAQKTYSIDDGLTYNQYWGLEEEEGMVGRYSSGDEVLAVQRRLSDLGYYSGELSGRFDDALIAAVLRFQGAAGVRKSGYIDGETKKALNAEDAPTAVSFDIEEGMLSPCVKTLQRNLEKLCLYNGEIDGLYDYELIQAVNRFQTIYGYDMTNTCTMMTQEAIQYEVDKINATFGTEEFTGNINSEVIPMAKINSGSRVRLRSDTRDNAFVVETLAPDTSVQLILEGPEWCQIKHGTQIGYMKTKYLKKYNAYLYDVEFTSASGKSYHFGKSEDGGSMALEFETVYKDIESNRANLEAQVLAEREAEKQAEEALRGVVNTGSDDVRLNLRAEPDAGSEIMTELVNGSEVQVLISNGEWTYVESEGTKGYLRSEYLEQYDKDGKKVQTLAQAMSKFAGEPADGTLFTYNGFTWVYSATDYKSEKLGYIRTGDPVKVYSTENDYCLVRFGEDFAEYGYIPADTVAYEEVSMETSTTIDESSIRKKQKIYAYVLEEVGHAYIYSSMNEASETLTSLDSGRRVTVVVADEESDWLEVKYKKFSGYMRNSDVRIDLEGD